MSRCLVTVWLILSGVTTGLAPGVNVTNLADLAVCPDAMQEIDMIFGSGDLVAVRVIYSGTQTGAMGPFPASGKRMTIPFMGILRVVNGKVAEMWVEWDNLGALAQLGHMPGPGSEQSVEEGLEVGSRPAIGGAPTSGCATATRGRGIHR